MKISAVHTVFLLLAIFAFVDQQLQAAGEEGDEVSNPECNGECNRELGACIDTEKPDINKDYCDREWQWCINQCSL